MQHPKDTPTLRYESSFSTLLSPDVYWVPARTLGDSVYTTQQMVQLVSLPPQEKRRRVSTLYEAMQLYVVSQFHEYIDVLRTKDENGVLWEHHKPGYYAMLDNGGCCASIASWLTYILDKKYEEVGIFTLVRESGNGHSFNYIRHKNWYYLIDLNPLLPPYFEQVAAETGSPRDFRRAKHYTGICIKAKSLDAYVRFYRRVLSQGQYRHLFYSFCGDPCIPISIKKEGSRVHIMFPKGKGIRLIGEGANTSAFTYSFVSPPRFQPDWALRTLDHAMIP